MSDNARRKIRRYTTICACLLWSIPFVGGAVFLLAYNEGHVRPRWAAGALALIACAIVGGLGWFTGAVADDVERQVSR